jgi:serine/threonine protein kinase
MKISSLHPKKGVRGSKHIIMIDRSRIICHTRVFLRRPAFSRGVHIWNPSVRASFGAAFSSTTPERNNAKVRPLTYNPISDVESLENYVPGGYHPIMIGDMLRDRYRVVDKLGFGGYSTVWLAQDTQLKCYVAVKVGTANSPARETAILRELSKPVSVSSLASQGRSSITFPLDEFELKGPNGTHPCYTMALADCDLRTVSYSRLFPINVARALSGEAVLAVAYLHGRGYAHGGML